MAKRSRRKGIPSGGDSLDTDPEVGRNTGWADVYINMESRSVTSCPRALQGPFTSCPPLGPPNDPERHTRKGVASPFGRQVAQDTVRGSDFQSKWQGKDGSPHLLSSLMKRKSAQTLLSSCEVKGRSVLDVYTS